ncbi:MAG: chloride channel protein [Myxococcota bacterium]
MASGGPSAGVKRKHAAQDRSHHITESWTHLARNFFIVFVITSMVWCFCSFTRFCVELGVHHLFEPVVHQKPHAMWILLGVMVAGGLLRGLLLQFSSWKNSEGDGVATAFMDFHNAYEAEDTVMQRYKKPTIQAGIQRMIMTILTVGTGGSGGLEAPVLPIGEQLASWVSKLFRNTSVDDLRSFQMAGIAAAVTTLLDAPFMAVLFTTEMLFADRMIYRLLIYSFFASIVAYALNNHFLAFQPLFRIQEHKHMYSLQEYAQVALVATLISAPAGLGVRWIFHRLRHIAQSIPLPYRPVSGAFGAGVIALLLWTQMGIEPRHVLGVGEESLKELLSGEGNPLLQVWWVLALLVVAKTLATGLTLMSGGSAGLLVPAMFLGGVSGASVYQFLEYMGVHAGPNANLFIVAGIASALVAVIEVPLAAICFVLEVFGSHFGPPAIVSVVLCHMFVRRLRLYENVERGD